MGRQDSLNSYVVISLSGGAVLSGNTVRDGNISAVDRLKSVIGLRLNAAAAAGHLRVVCRFGAVISASDVTLCWHLTPKNQHDKFVINRRKAI